MSDPLSVYIHVPFCIKKCDYCDFYSQVDLTLIPEYIQALIREIDLRSEPGTTVETLYFGGGTPSVLPADKIEALLCTVQKNFKVSSSCEITLEANPGTVNNEALTEYNSMGINRLSLGVQSFNDDKLKFLNRIHSAEQARTVIDLSRNAGFENISIDLIYGLPFENENSWRNELNQALDIGLEHFSCYMLTVESGTQLEERINQDSTLCPDPGLQSSMFELTSRVFIQQGYEHYEISSFALNRQFRSRHNQSYWQGDPYKGFGASAHSYNGSVNRTWNHSDIQQYLDDVQSGNLPRSGNEKLSLDQQVMEKIMLGLRTSDGIDLKQFESRFQYSLKDSHASLIKKILQNGYGVLENNRFFLTLTGRLHLNGIVEQFVAPFK